MSVKNELSNKKEKALLCTWKFNDVEPNERVKVKEKSEATPINGLDLLKYCAFCGAMIDNAEEINLEDDYFLEFLGCGTYKATKAEKYSFVKIDAEVALRKISAGENVYQKYNDTFKLMNGEYDISGLAYLFCHGEWYAENN